MAASVTHQKVSLIPDAGDATLIEPSDWNAAHVITGLTIGVDIEAWSANLDAWSAVPVANMQAALTLTTTGSSGAATLTGATLNIPNYTFTDTGITQLTADVTAGPGSGSKAATVVALNGTNLAGLTTGLLVNTTGTGIPTIKTAPAGLVVGTSDAQTLTNKNFAGAGNVFPTFNQNTTGSAAKWTTARLLAGNNADGSANVPFANSFIVQGTADSGLTGAQFMGALGTGIVKNTTTTGVQSIAAAGTDYVAPGGALGTPSSGVATNLTGTAAGLTAGNVTTNANLTGPITSVGNATSIASSVALPGSPTTTTQTANDNSTKIATTAYVDSKVSGGRVLLATMTPSGSPSTLTSANFVSTPYSDLELVLDAFLTSAAGATTINVSANNASTFDTASNTMNTGAASSFIVQIARAGITANHILSGPSGGASNVLARFASQTSPITNIRIAVTSGTITSGNVYVYGVP